jgi:nitrogen fixation NifU-like protein
VSGQSTAFRSAVVEHFKHPHNRGSIVGATVSIEGSNPLCGDRIRIELLVEARVIAAAGFTADACAICIAAASVITERARGARVDAVQEIDSSWVERALEGAPPPTRRRCVTLAVDTLHRAAAAATAMEERP